jgi:cell division protein FtsW
VEALRLYGSSWLFFKRQVIWVVVGAVALAVGFRVDYQMWRRLAVPLLVLSAVLLVLVLVPGLGLSARGSSRWLGYGELRMQPSELAKLAVLLFASEKLTRHHEGERAGAAGLRAVLLAFLLVAALVMLQPDMGTTLIIAGVVGTVLFVGGTPLRSLVSLAGVMGAGGLVLALHEGYRRMRLMSFVNPWRDAGNSGYQIVQSLIGFGTGHITGVGLGASRAKWGFLPNAHTDFIFAIIGEELGLVGSLLVVALFAAFAVLGVRASLRAPDRFGALVAAGVTAWVVGQAILNMGTVIGVLPVTGVPLPLVSFGGSSLVITLAALGIFLNVCRQTR